MSSHHQDNQDKNTNPVNKEQNSFQAVCTMIDTQAMFGCGFENIFCND